MKDVVVIDYPADLPVIVARLRKASGVTRSQVSRDIAVETVRDARSLNTQIAAWELGYKSPFLATPLVEPYLRQHGWKLALISIADRV